MEKINNICIQYLKYAWPVTIIATIFAFTDISFNSHEPGRGAFINLLIDLIGWAVVLWCIIFAYLFFAIAFNPKLRSSFVRKLANIKENDERESQITGLVSKKTFITTTGILILLLFLSALQIEIYRTPGPDDGKHGKINIGLHMSLVKKEKSPPTKEELERMYIIKYDGLPLTADGAFLLVVIMQVGFFYYFSKNETLAME